MWREAVVTGVKVGYHPSIFLEESGKTQKKTAGIAHLRTKNPSST
jgi:hypothetical protein